MKSYDNRNRCRALVYRKHTFQNDTLWDCTVSHHVGRVHRVQSPDWSHRQSAPTIWVWQINLETMIKTFSHHPPEDTNEAHCLSKSVETLFYCHIYTTKIQLSKTMRKVMRDSWILKQANLMPLMERWFSYQAKVETLAGFCSLKKGN